MAVVSEFHKEFSIMVVVVIFSSILSGVKVLMDIWWLTAVDQTIKKDDLTGSLTLPQKFLFETSFVLYSILFRSFPTTLVTITPVVLIGITVMVVPSS